MDPLDQLRALHQTLEFNCSVYDFDITPPNVTTHFEALGIIGYGLGIGGAASTGLLIILFAVHVFVVIMKCPESWRRLLAWITSMPMVISLLSLATFLVPRAGSICDIVKQSYMPFLMMHFIDLAVLIEGGEDAVLESLEQDETPLTLCVPPCCFLGACCCKVPTNKKRYRLFRNLVYQTPLLQFLLTVTVLVLKLADLDKIISFNVAEAIFQALALLNFLIFAFGNWGFNVIVKAFKGPLKSVWNKSIQKGTALSLFITLLKLQNFVLGVVDYTGNIPCVPPSVSTLTMKKSIDAGLTLIEAFLFGVVFLVVFRVMPKDKTLATEGDEDSSALVQPMSRYWMAPN